MNLPKIQLTDGLRTDKVAQYGTQKKLVEDKSWVCCANCFNVSEFNCKKHNLPIPPLVAVLGCNDWDGLPF